jgi:SNF2 family DNA or RNA helicase
MTTSLPCITHGKVELQAHSVDVVKRLLTQKGVIAVFGVGSGKTLASISSATCIMDANPGVSTLVITPTSLTGNYKKEMVKWGLDADDPRFEFRTFGEMLSQNKSNKNNVPFCENKILVIDEAHFLRTKIVKARKEGKSDQGKIAQVMVSCAKKAFRVLLLTATPVVNARSDLINLIAMVNQADPIGKEEFEQIIENDASLARYIGNSLMFYTRPKNDPNYPTVHEQDVILTMPQDFYDKYHMIELNDFAHLKAKDIIKAKDVFRFLSALREAMNVANIEKESPKIDYAIKIAECGDGRHGIGPTLIYSAWKKAGIYLIAEALKAKNIPFAQLDGDMPKSKRQLAVDAYNNKTVRVLLITAAGGVGLDLKETLYLLCIDIFWADAGLQQLIGRAARFKSHQGTNRDIWVYKLYMKKPARHLFFGGRAWSDKLESADMMLQKYVAGKTKQLEEFVQKLEELSKENAKTIAQ